GLNFLSPVKELTKPVSKFILHELTNLIDSSSSNQLMGWVGLVLAIILLLVALKYMVSALKILVVSKAKIWFDKYLFSTAGRAFTVGILLTILVQSSSITTSLVVPMAGAGLLTLIQIFPYTLGSNIGTTVTAMLAALMTGSLAAITVAFAHLLFNISGILVWWPFKKVPITLAEKFAEYSTKNKLIPVAYVLIMFFIIPILVIFIFN
ncbi:MAG: Na/Pi symporter, partial [Candidatus Pacebacteria bacterium]|nr:Na/Pi symporter [Candidatus Paceibacterota bacterium]